MKDNKLKNSGKTALVTGANSGLGFEAARQIAAAGWGRVILACRSLDKAEATAVRLQQLTDTMPFVSLAIDTTEVDSARAAVAELQRQGGQINFLLLNAAATTRRPQLNSDGVELTYASTLIGHHVITALALKEGMLAPNARVVIAGSESARGNVPGEQGHDFAQIAEQQFAGDRVAAVEAFLRLAVPAQNDFRNMREYGTAKLFVAWWAASMARRLPPGMTVNAVSPGGALDTNFGRDANAILRYGLLPILRVLGPLTGLSGTVEAGARRYIEAEAYAADQTGNFYATANRKKVAGPVGLQTWPAFFRDEENQEACFEALVKITGVRL